MRHHTLRSSLPILTAALLVSLTPALAKAERDDSSTVLALDLDLALPVNDSAADPGGGAAVRFGRKISLLLLSLTPEVGLGYHKFSGASEAALYRAFVGGRVGIGAIIEPSVFGHIAIGKLDHTSNDRWAPVADVGLALDFTLLPLLDLGVHGAYNTALPRDAYNAFSWFSAGVHAALVF